MNDSRRDSTGSRPKFVLPHPRRLTRRPLDTRRTVTSQRLGPGSRHAPSRSESTLETYCRGDERAPCQRRHSAKADPCCVEGDPSSQTAGSERQERWGQRRRGKPRPGRDLRTTGPACPRDRGRRFPPNQSGWPMFFALMSSFSRETEFTTSASEEIATARSRHASKRRQIPMSTSPRRRARCNHHEAPAAIVALILCCLLRLSTGGSGPLGGIISLPECTQRSTHCGAWIRTLSVVTSEAAAMHCFMLCSTKHRSQIQNLSIFHSTQKTDQRTPLSEHKNDRGRIY